MSVNLRDFLMSLAATTVSIVLTFGTTAIIDRKKQREEKREMTLMIMFDMRESLDNLRQIDSDLKGFFDIQVDVLSHPDTGVSFLPDYIFQENFPRSVLPQLAILRLGDEDYIWHFSMIRKKGKTQMTDARRFWNCIADLAERPE